VDSANALLDAAGWLRGTDSLRRKNGQLLTFGMLTPSSSNARMRAAILLQEQFRRVGVDARVESVDFPSFVKRSSNRQFDTIINQWSPDPGPGSVNEEWTSAAAAPGGNNFDNYRNPSFDAQVDSALASFLPDTMRVHLARAWRILTDDAAAIWLAEPQRVMAVHKRIQTTGIRPGAWWAGLAQWSIPADQRIARDRPAAGAAR
jgi:ABC-type transport system substrate-binding protein